MNKKFKITTAILCSGLIITPVSGIIQNNQNFVKAEYKKNNILSNQEKEYVVAKAKEFNLSDSQVENIIRKLEKGQLLDAFNPEKKPVKSTKVSNTEYIYYYDDGSVIKQTIIKDNKTKEKKHPNTTFRSVNGGNVYWGSNFKYTSNALIKNDTLYGNFTFRADYANLGHLGGQIDNVYDARYWGIGTYSDISLWIQESKGDPARAVMTVNWSAPAGVASSLLKLELFVNGTDAWTGQ